MFDLKLKNEIINWKEFTVYSTNPGWESNSGHFSGIIQLDYQDLRRCCQHSLNETDIRLLI